MEVLGLNAELIDVAVYTQQALEATAHIARILGEPNAAKRYQQMASRLKASINQRFWVAEDGLTKRNDKRMVSASSGVEMIGLAERQP